VFVRYGTHLALMLALFGRREGRGLVRTSRPAVQVARSLAMFAMPLLFLAASARIAPSAALAIFWMAPLLMIVLDRGAPAALTGWFAALTGFAGVLLIVQPELELTPGGVVFAGGMALCLAGYLQLTRMTAGDSEVTNLFHTALWVFLAMGPLALPHWVAPTAAGWASLAAVGVLGFVALLALDVALRHASPSAIAPVFYVQPVVALLLESSSTHGRFLTPAAIAGALVVMAVVGISSRSASVVRHPVTA
jgi:drug/metabolite transporter (DMT)-like permease